MAVIVAKEIVKDTKEMRGALSEALIARAKDNKNLVYLDADLSSSMSMKNFAKAYPDQYLNVGIAEANMVGIAAGLSATGKVPFTHTFGPFATRRCYDQIFLSCAYGKNNVKIIGSDPGVTAAFNGGTHMPFEDVALMRAIPGCTVVEPTDTTMVSGIIDQIIDTDGLFYIRLKRKTAVKVYEEGSTFTIGKAVTAREGSDVTLIACGIMVEEALKAAALLEAEGISARVLDMFTVKPIDREAVLKAADETGAIVTCENHNVIGGLYSAVADVIVSERLVPMERVGVEESFGEVGPEDYLRKRFGLTAEHIVEMAKKAVARKK